MNVQVDKFEGPLGLLLHLIRKEEMDIFDINIYQITKQYMEFIRTMKKLDLEKAGDFIAMAATLIQIKSRMLLPQYNEEGEEELIEDPRKELVQKLLEYQKYQDVSQRLYERPLLGRDLWLRGEREKIESDQDDEIIVEENPLFSLIIAYRLALKNMKSSIHRVGTELQSISERILELKDQLIVGVKNSFFHILGKKNDRNQVLVTFLSLLELTRMGFLKIFQTENFSDIHVIPQKPVDRDVISKVDSFEAANTEAMAEAIFASQEIIVSDEDMEESLDDETESSGNSFEAEGYIEDEEDVESGIHGVKSYSRKENDLDNDMIIEAATDEEIAAEELRWEQEGKDSDGRI